MSGFERELAQFVQDHRRPDAYRQQASEHFLPLIDWLLERMDRVDGLIDALAGASGDHSPRQRSA